MRSPDFRAQRVLDDIASGTAPSEDYTDAMREWRTRNEGGDVSEAAEIAFDMRASGRQKEIIESLLLSECPLDVIADAFNVPVEASKAYAELFYDVSVFRTRLDRLDHVLGYDDETGRDLRMKALSLGYEFVLYTYASIVPKTAAQKRLLERMFMATAYKAMAMNYNGIRTETNRQAVKHAELMLKAHDALARLNVEDTEESNDLVALLAAAPADIPDARSVPKPGEIV